ncbi:MAG: cytochrome c biogenesis protein, partial [Roseimicrobium sp.]
LHHEIPREMLDPACGGVLALANGLAAQDKPVPLPQPSVELFQDPEIVEPFASLPVQEMGRIKPLETLARFRLLRFSGKQASISGTRLDEATGTKVPVTDPATGKPLVNAKGKPYAFSAMQWLLVTWFRPDVAKELPVFVVDNSDAIIELGLPGKGKRDRYSYNEIVAGREALMRKMSEMRQQENEARQQRKTLERSPVERALGKLAMDFLDYEMMLGHFDFARAPFSADTTSVPAELSAHLKQGRADWPAMLPALTAYLKAHPEAGAPMSNPWLREFFRSMLGAMMSGDETTVLRIFPPPAEKVEVWHGPGTVLQTALQGGEVSKADLEHLTAYATLAQAAAGDVAVFKAKLKALHDDLQKLANSRGESGHIGLELNYHRTDYPYQALLYFTFGLFFIALSWVKPQSGWAMWLRRICLALVGIGAVYATVGIIIRCLIMERPPITTLYETILFITAAAVIAALLTEWASRKGVALAVAAVAGTAGMFLSIRFMNLERTDTMVQLQAVLITNFWLATHVPCINLGYTAGMVASFFSIGYVIARSLGMVKAGDANARELTRMAYAFVLAGLLLSLVGTVLGGIWANYSWGRFWGWDPKENGALMIVLMNLVILHARLGGFVREVGFHACSLLLGMITVFSWFATNQLGVGLHSYGAMEGAWMWLYIYWGFMALMLLCAIVIGWVDRKRKTSAPSAALPVDTTPA